MAIRLDDRYLKGFVRDHELASYAPAVKAAHETLLSRKGPGNDFQIGRAHV